MRSSLAFYLLSVHAVLLSKMLDSWFHGHFASHSTPNTSGRSSSPSFTGTNVNITAITFNVMNNIEMFLISHRFHSYIEYKNPNEFEKQIILLKAALGANFLFDYIALLFNLTPSSAFWLSHTGLSGIGGNTNLSFPRRCAHPVVPTPLCLPRCAYPYIDSLQLMNFHIP